MAAKEDGHWEYIAIAETVSEIAGYREFDFDGQPGLVYTGPTGAAIRVQLNALSVGAGIAGVIEGGTTDIALFLDNDYVVGSDEGPVDVAEAATDFNFDTYVNINEGQAVRVVLINEETGSTDDYDVAIDSLTIT